jgi:hypothetical protein
VLRHLEHVIDLGDVKTEWVATQDAFDAVICVLAGLDFIRGEVHRPLAEEVEVVRREGWIWLDLVSAVIRGLSGDETSVSPALRAS